VLVHRQPSTPPLAESLPPSTRKLLTLVGLDAAVESASFHPNTGTTSRWAQRVSHAGSPDAGVHVSRDVFDRLLLRAAGGAGAQILNGVVTDVDASGARVTWRDADGASTCTADYLLDCSGRAGIVARKGLRTCNEAYRTLAVAATWHVATWPDGEQTETVIDSAPDGWAWSVPISSTTRQCTIMIDPAQAARTGRSLQSVYERALARMDFLATRLAGARQVSPPFTCDASVYGCSRAADGRALLVGDAASFVEPLSSAGVKKAIMSAWRAAVVVNTCLLHPERKHAALDYHTVREREVADACSREASRFFDEGAGGFGRPFWVRRSECARPAQTSSDRDVASAFERLRASRDARVRVSPDVRIEATATIEGREVVLRDALVLPDGSAPLQFSSNVNLPELVRIVGRHPDVPSVLAAYQSHIGGVAPADLLRGLSLLLAHKALIHEGAA